MEIDLVKLAGLKMTINEYLTLVKLEGKKNGIDIPFNSTKSTLDSLRNSKYITIDSRNMIELTDIGRDVVNPKDKVSFDELFFMYPDRTPGGRILRVKNKEVGGKLTKDYKFLRDKYLSKVKKDSLHKEILKATEAMIVDKKNRGSQEYMRQLEFYINRQEWEQYFGEEIKEVNSSTNNWERI